MPIIKQKIEPGKIIVLYGPRRVGKTTALQTLATDLKDPHRILMLNGEQTAVQRDLSIHSVEHLKNIIGGHTLLIVDEAQKIPLIGTTLKLIVDHLPDVAVIASGSASLALSHETGEPLTGRKKTLRLYPISVSELIAARDRIAVQELLEELLIFGSYPELFRLADRDQKREYLRELADAYLFRDILEIDGVKNAKILRDLLTLLAFQIGKQVSMSELGNNLNIHQRTVARYLDLLEKSFIILPLRGFSRNLRKEVSKTQRYYFLDIGIRNALINAFNPLTWRDDIGALWENFIIMERIKKQSYSSIDANNYFWRTYDQKEIDWIEEREGKLFGYEVKWSGDKKKAPKDWLSTYPNATYEVVTRDNYLEFVS